MSDFESDTSGARERQLATPSVVVSGLGTLGPAGLGVEALALALAEGRAATRHDFGAPPSDLSPWLSPRAARRMSPPSKLAVVATRMALEDAGLDGEGLPAPVAVVAATSFGPSSFTEGLLAQIFGEGPQAASPFYFTESVANAAAAQVALVLRARGPNITVTQREAGPWIALARAAAEIRRGRAASAVVLAVDEMTELLLDVLDRFGAHASGPARPFDRRRDGLVASQGATALVLEAEDRVGARGGKARARVRGGIQGFDPGATATSWSDDPTALVAVLERGLGRLGLSPADCDRVVSGASGTRAGDRLEAKVLRCLFGGASPTVLAPKSVAGEYAGGQLAAALLALSDRPWGATAGFAEPDPELDLVPHDGRALPSPRRVLAGSLAAGGAAAWGVLESVDPVADPVVDPSGDGGR